MIASLMSACESRDSRDVGVVPQARRGRVLEHVAQPALERYLDAYVYGDVSGATRAHIASTSQNTWCESRAFMNLLDELQRSKDDAACEQAQMITSDDGASASLQDEELLMLQTMRFVCEHAEATCQTYSQSVYRSTLTQTPYWKARLERYEVRTMTEQGDEEVKAYVDLHFPQPVGVRRELVVMKRVGGDSGGWFVFRGLEVL